MRAHIVLVGLLICVGSVAEARGAGHVPDAARYATRLAAIPDWGPPTAIDGLEARLWAARIRDDATAFAAVRDSLWALRPHSDVALEQSVLWVLRHQQALELAKGPSAGRLEALFGLKGLNDSDRRLVAGLTAMYSGLSETATRMLVLSAAESPPRSAALSSLVWLEGRRSNTATTLDAALASPEATVDLLWTMALASPDGPLGEWREAAAARIAALPPRPQLASLGAVLECTAKIRQQGLTPALLGDALDELHRRYPVEIAARMDDLLGDALVWLEPDALRPVLEARAAWLPGAMLLKCRGKLAEEGGRSHEAYRLYLEAVQGQGGLPKGRLVALAPMWHADAAEALAWARGLAVVPADVDFDAIAYVMEMQGQQAGADSVRALGVREQGMTMALGRLFNLTFTDPSSALALLDSLQSALPPYAVQRAGLHLAEATGDTTFLARLLAGDDAFAVAELLPLAAMGAQQAGNRARLERLGQLADERTPQRRQVWRLRVDAALGDHDPQAAYALLEKRPPESMAWADMSLYLRAALVDGRDDQARNLAASYLERQDLDAAELTELPMLAEAAGWTEVADRALARLEELAPEAPVTALTRGHLLTRRGDLAGARAAIEPAAARWTTAPYFRNALVATGNAMENYADPAPTRDVALFGGLGLEYASTDWILERAAEVTAQPGSGQMILQDRHSVMFASRERLTYRHRIVVQMLSESGIAQFTPYRFEFAGQGEPPRVICARTITPEGDVREVSKSDIMVTAHQGDDADVSDMRDMVIPFTNLKPGMIVDLCIETTPTTSFAGAIWTHHFGNTMPQAEELVEYVVAPGVEHVLADKHAPVPTEGSELAGGRLYRWSYRDVPVVTAEDQAPAMAVFPDWVGCSTCVSWEEVGRRYAVDFWNRAEPDDAIRELAKSLTASDRDDVARLASLFTFVKDEIENVGVELGRGWYVPSPAAEVVRRRYGDCKEKVAVLTALLQVIGLECRPVLVGARPSVDVHDDYPNPGSFNHLVAFVPDVDGGAWCDPTLGAGCRNDLPVEICGQRGLVMERGGRSRLVTLPEHDDTEAELEYIIDLRPQPDGALKAFVDITARHATAHATGFIFDVPDTATVANVITYLADAKTENGFFLRSREHTKLDCGDWHVTAVMRDSTWASAGQHDARVTWLSAADDILDLPTTKDRKLPLVLDARQWTRVTVRAHEAPGWQLASRVAPIHVEGPGVRGEITVSEHEANGDRWLEVRRELHLSQREYSAAELPEFVRKYNSHKLGCLQPFVWRRQEDETRVARLVEYAQANPTDIGFAIQASQQLLGGDLGGDGEAGRSRRAQVRELLAPALAANGTDAAPYLILARMARKDDRWVEADSLLTHALTLAPREPGLLGAAVYVKEALCQYEAAIELDRRYQSNAGGSGTSYELIRMHLTLGQDALADRELERLRLMAPDLDEERLLSARAAGYLYSGRLDEARRVFADGRHLLDDMGVLSFRMDIAGRARHWDEAAAIADSMLAETPLDPRANNNLAWYLACAGRDLERAEYAIGMASAIAGTNRRDNTLALVLLRQGRVEEARTILRELLADDRPVSRVANGYLLGLSYWWAGEREQALACWRPLADVVAYNELTAALREALAAVEAGKDPSWIYLWPKPAGS